jgi:hypothetical protein
MPVAVEEQSDGTTMAPSGDGAKEGTMGKWTLGRGHPARKWGLGVRRPSGRRTTTWYPQAQTQVEPGPTVTLPLAADMGERTLMGYLVAWLLLDGDAQQHGVPAAMAVGFGGPDLAPAMVGRSA